MMVMIMMNEMVKDSDNSNDDITKKMLNGYDKD